MLAWVVRLVAGMVVVMTVLPLVREKAWWIRVCEFPRAQLLGLAVLVLTALPFTGPSPAELVLLALAVLGSAVFQATRILPFTPLWRRGGAARVADGAGSFGLLVANVLMTNRQVERFMALVRDLEPQILLVIEADRWWQEALEPLHREYPFRVEHPQEDTYGMLLLSRSRIVEQEVRFLVSPEVPSIRCRLAVADAVEVELHALHPKPPAPQEATETTRRDLELLLVAEEVRNANRPTIVAGDLNDVAWSYTTRRFRRISGLVDPRVGYGLFATFPASRPWLRFPLDHIFHSTDLRPVELRVGRRFGSDHLPIFARLRLGQPGERTAGAPGRAATR